MWPTKPTANDQPRQLRGHVGKRGVRSSRTRSDSIFDPLGTRVLNGDVCTRGRAKERRVCEVSRGTPQPLKIETRLRSIIEGGFSGRSARHRVRTERRGRARYTYARVRTRMTQTRRSPSGSMPSTGWFMREGHFDCVVERENVSESTPRCRMAYFRTEFQRDFARLGTVD